MGDKITDFLIFIIQDTFFEQFIFSILVIYGYRAYHIVRYGRTKFEALEVGEFH